MKNATIRKEIEITKEIISNIKDLIANIEKINKYADKPTCLKPYIHKLEREETRLAFFSKGK